MQMSFCSARVCVCVCGGQVMPPTSYTIQQRQTLPPAPLLALKTVLIPLVSHENSEAYTISGTYRICSLIFGPILNLPCSYSCCCSCYSGCCCCCCLMLSLPLLLILIWLLGTADDIIATVAPQSRAREAGSL